MTQKAGIVISLIILFSFQLSFSQTRDSDYEAINALINYLKPYNQNSIVYIQREVLITEWEKNLNFAVLSENRLGKSDLRAGETPFDSIPISKYLNSYDLEFMIKSLSSLKLRKWDKSIIKSNLLKIIRPKPRLTARGIKKGKPYYKISEPLYSEDGDIAIIMVENYISPLSGSGDIYIMIKRNGWHLLCEIPLWLS